MNHFKTLTLVSSLLIGIECIAQYPQHRTSNLFATDEVLNITLSGDIKTLTSDRSDDMAYHAMTFSYEANGILNSIPLKVKTRGHFRRTMGNCHYPPLLLNFDEEDTPVNSTFSGQNK